MTYDCILKTRKYLLIFVQQENNRKNIHKILIFIYINIGINIIYIVFNNIIYYFLIYYLLLNNS